MTDTTTLLNPSNSVGPTSLLLNNSSIESPGSSKSISMTASPSKRNKINNKKRPLTKPNTNNNNNNKNNKSNNEPPKKKRKIMDTITQMFAQNKTLKQTNLSLRNENKKMKMVSTQNETLKNKNEQLKRQNDFYRSILKKMNDIAGINNNNKTEQMQQFVLIKLTQKYKTPINKNNKSNKKVLCSVCKNNPNDMNNKLLICNFCTNSNAIHLKCNPIKYCGDKSNYACNLCRNEMKKEHLIEYKALMRGKQMNSNVNVSHTNNNTNGKRQEMEEEKCNNMSGNNCNKSHTKSNQEKTQKNNHSKESILNSLKMMGFDADKIKNVMAKYPKKCNDSNFIADQLLQLSKETQSPSKLSKRNKMEETTNNNRNNEHNSPNGNHKKLTIKLNSKNRNFK